MRSRRSDAQLYRDLLHRLVTRAPYFHFALLYLPCTVVKDVLLMMFADSDVTRYKLCHVTSRALSVT